MITINNRVRRQCHGPKSRFNNPQAERIHFSQLRVMAKKGAVAAWIGPKHTHTRTHGAAAQQSNASI